jgi:hypothetical protein
MKQLKLLVVLAAIGLFSFQACKKDSKEDISDDTASQIQHSQDETNFTSETEATLDDVNAVVGFSGLGKGISISGATIDSVIADKKYIINYNGNNAAGTRFRSGQVVVQLTTGLRWRDQNAVLTITFNNLMIKNIATNKSITVSGTKVVTNVNGGLVNMLTPGGSSIIHKITGNMNVTFDDGTSKVWSIYRQREILITAAGIPTIKISGFGVADGLDNVVVAGINRAGNPFSTIINQTVEITKNTNCFNGAWVAVSGKKTHKRIAREITVTFGVDQSGNQISSGCPYGYKIEWTNLRNDSKQAIISY